MILRAGTVYICGYYNFPKGSASSNYVQNFAQVCLLLGYHIVLMTNVNHKEDIKKHPFLADHPQQVTLHEITLSAGRLSHYVAYNFRLGKYFKEALCQYKIGVNDLLVSYSTLPSINRLLLSLGKCTNVKTCACVVEWFSSKAFPYGKASRRYWEYAYNFYRLFPQFDGIFSISSMLHQHFLNENCHSVVFPILSDPYEYEYIPKTFAGDSAKFIYATNSSKKDTIDVVLNAFGTLSDENLKKCELHLLGADPDMIMNTIPADSRTRVKNILHIHEWLTYGELVCLYYSMGMSDCFPRMSTV